MGTAVQLDVESPRGPQTIRVAQGRERRLTDLLRRENLPLNTRCGQRGLCDGCIVELLAGTVVHASTGQPLPAAPEPQSIRGCEYHLGDSDVRLRIPVRSLLAYEPQVVSEFRLNVPRAHDPVWQIIEVPADGPIEAAIARQTKRRRPIRIAGGSGVPAATGPSFATLEYRDDHWLVTHLRPKKPDCALGGAIDIGTTTVVVLLVDLCTGAILARASDFNKQMHLGDDVATRIGLCATPGMLRQLQEAIIQQTIRPLLDACLRQAGATEGRVACLSVTANTTMLHLFAGVDPSPMGYYPFTPGFLNHRIIQLPEFGDATIHLLPSAAAYIGSDLTAGVLSSGLAYDDGPSLLVDVGTNGEIILKTPNHVLGCATAAGPAFEGAGLTNGIRAGQGAVETIRMTNSPFNVQAKVIGQTKPIGICGSAYVDFLAEGRRAGILTPTGRFHHAALRGAGDALQKMEDGWALRVARGQGQHDILISETDVAHLLQAKGAIGAGILTLLERSHLTPARIQKLYLAGGFGMHIDIPNAIACGLLPGFKPEQIEVVGNTSLAGAYLGLLDCGALDEIARLAKGIEMVELNLDPGFEDRYIEQLSLP